MKLRLTSLLAALLLTPTAARADGTIEAHTLSSGDKSPYPYAVWLPPGYDADTAHKYPLVLFIHGLGECGDGTKDSLLKKQPAHGPLKLIKNGSTYFADHKVIVVAPQVPSADGWFSTDKLAKQVDYFLATYRVNRKRVYTTGISMGGGGTWEVTKARADSFAAILPICGAADPQYTKDFSPFDGVPVWAFHAWGDGTVNRTNTVGWGDGIADMLAGSNVAGMLDTYPHDGADSKPAKTTMTGLFSDKKWSWKNDVVASSDAPLRVTFYTDGAHDSWTRTYDKPEVWDWLLSHQRYTGDNNDAPVAKAGPDQSVEGDGPTVSVTLDGSGSFDPDGAVESHAWTEDGKALATGDKPSLDLGPGTHTITLTVTDDNGAKATDTVTVQVKAGSGAGGGGQGGEGGQGGGQGGEAGSGQGGAGSGPAGQGGQAAGSGQGGAAGKGQAGVGPAGQGGSSAGQGGTGQGGAAGKGPAGQGGKGPAGQGGAAGGKAGAAGSKAGSAGLSGSSGQAGGEGELADEGSGGDGGCQASPGGAAGAAGWALAALAGLAAGRRRRAGR